MRRRDFIIGGAATWALPALGHMPAIPVIGYLGPESPERFASRVAAFREGLAEAGYVEGRNVAIEFRWAEGQYGRLPALAADLARRQVSLIAAPGGPRWHWLQKRRPTQSLSCLRWEATQ